MRSFTTLDLQYAHRFYGFKGEAQYLHGHTGILTLEVDFLPISQISPLALYTRLSCFCLCLETSNMEGNPFLQHSNEI